MNENIDVSVFVRWVGKNPFNDQAAEYIWCGSQSAILIIPLNIYYSLRLFISTGWKQHLTEIQLILPKTKKPC